MDAFAELKAQIEQLVNELKETLAERATATEDKFEVLEAKIEDIKGRAEKLEGVIEQTERLYLPGIEVGHGEVGKWSWGRAMKVVSGLAKPGDASTELGCGLEIEAFSNMAKQYESLPTEAKTAMNAATDAAGGFLVPLDVMQGILPELDDVSIARQLGVTSMDGLVGNVRWVKDAGGITIDFIDTETEETAAESVSTFESIEVKPHVAVGVVPLTWSMLNQPAVAIDGFIRSRLATKIALKEDEMVFLGDAANSEPRGIINTSGISTMTWGTDSPALAIGPSAQTATDGLRAMIKKLAKSKALQGARSLGWAASTDSMFFLMSAKDSDNRDVFQAGQATPTGLVNSLMGYPARLSEQLDSGDDEDEFLLFGDFSQCILPHWGTLAFAASDQTETNFRKLRTTIRAVMAFDVGVLEPAAFCQSSGLDTTTAPA